MVASTRADERQTLRALAATRGTDFEATFAPVCSTDGEKVMFAVGAEDRVMLQLNVKSRPTKPCQENVHVGQARGTRPSTK